MVVEKVARFSNEEKMVIEEMYKIVDTLMSNSGGYDWADEYGYSISEKDLDTMEAVINIMLGCGEGLTSII